jgi:hypothetical protein
MTTEQDGEMMRRYWTNACPNCLLKSKCTTGNERCIPRWEHEHVLEAAQKRLDENPQAMRARRETVEHPFGTLKMRMGATHFLVKRLPKVATEMALHVLGYNLTRVMSCGLSWGFQVTQNDLWDLRECLQTRDRRKSQSARLRVLASQSEAALDHSETFLRNQDPERT